MRTEKYFILVMALALILPFSAFARGNNQGHLVLDQPTMIGSTQLQPGNYKVAWAGSGSDLNVSITQHNKVVATAQGQLKAIDAAAVQDAVVLHPASGSSQMALSEIDFGNRHQALVIVPNGSNSSDQTQ